VLRDFAIRGRVSDILIICKTIKIKIMSNLKIELEKYREWALKQSWNQSKEDKEPVVIREAPNDNEIKLLIDKFGQLPKSYLETLKQFGLSEFTYESYKTKMLAPAEIIELYDIVQDEMDFSDGLREEILEEDGLDFSKYIPVMAGDGQDGCWALLNIDKESKGEILYWDTEQAGHIEDVFNNLNTFILKSLSRAKQENPLRLT
jgi:hypothetical protein